MNVNEVEAVPKHINYMDSFSPVKNERLEDEEAISARNMNMDHYMKLNLPFQEQEHMNKV